MAKVYAVNIDQAELDKAASEEEDGYFAAGRSADSSSTREFRMDGPLELAGELIRGQEALLKQQRGYASIQILLQYNRSNFAEARRAIDAKFPQPLNGLDKKAIAALMNPFLEDRQKFQPAAELMLGYYEEVSIAVQEGHVDERVIYRSLVRVVQKDWQKLRPYAEYKKKLEDIPEIYQEVELLANAWSHGMFLSTGRAVDSDLPQIDLLSGATVIGANAPMEPKMDQRVELRENA